MEKIANVISGSLGGGSQVIFINLFVFSQIILNNHFN